MILLSNKYFYVELLRHRLHFLRSFVLFIFTISKFLFLVTNVRVKRLSTVTSVHGSVLNMWR